MVSASGRFVMAFNGEIYNHLSLRSELLKSGNNVAWRGHSDTETLLACIETWGLDTTLKACIGMFALALWDREESCIYIARDRMGEKPLYYGWQKDVFLFASELKALNVHPAFEGEINRDALTILLRHGYISAPHTIYTGIHKLQAGVALRIPVRNGRAVSDSNPVPYWKLHEFVDKPVANPYPGGEKGAINDLDHRLQEAIRLQMVADVPVGVFLSGGIDSSTIAALMQAQSAKPVNTYTIGFYERSYDEADYAREIAKHLGTEHTELYVTSAEAMESIPSLATLYDEPFGDSSQIPTFLVSKLARHQVKVALSGDGADELFGGYNRYVMMSRLWAVVRTLPRTARNGITAGIRSLSPLGWGLLYGYLSEVLPGRLQLIHMGDKLYKLTEILQCDGPEDLYRGLVSHWKNPADVVIGGREPGAYKEIAWNNFDIERHMMHLDSAGYLPDDILLKLDRAAMGVSMETRVPFLDHRVVEFAWGLPSSMKIRDGNGKWILRQVLKKYVPVSLTNRPKMGFSVPIDLWLRGPLREWAESLIGESRLRDEGYFRPELIRKTWSEHVTGRRNSQHALWAVLMFQSWLDQQGRVG